MFILSQIGIQLAEENLGPIPVESVSHLCKIIRIQSESCSRLQRNSMLLKLDMLDANLLCKFVLQIVEKHLRWTMAV